MNIQPTPPPPHKSFYSNYLAFSLLLATIFSCDPPSQGASAPPTYTISGKVTDQFGKTIRGQKKIQVTPGNSIRRATYRLGFADDTKAQVWVDPANKVDVKADGSYTLTVKGPGTYQVTAGYTGKDGNYKNSDPQTVKITGQTHSLDIPLKFGYTTTVNGTVRYEISVGIPPNRHSGATVIIETDYGTKIGEGISDRIGDYSITVSHAGKFTIKASALVAGTKATDNIPNIETTAPNMTGTNLLISP